jgi:hypothetical protein
MGNHASPERLRTQMDFLGGERTIVSHQLERSNVLEIKWDTRMGVRCLVIGVNYHLSEGLKLRDIGGWQILPD